MVIQQGSADAIEMDENRRIESAESVERVGEVEGNRDGMSGEERQKEGKRKRKSPWRDEGNVETREEEHGNEGGANTQERAMAVGKRQNPLLMATGQIR
jgi:hypothetical protein